MRTLFGGASVVAHALGAVTATMRKKRGRRGQRPEDPSDWRVATEHLVTHVRPLDESGRVDGPVQRTEDGSVRTVFVPGA